MENRKEELLRTLYARLEGYEDFSRTAYFKADELNAPMDVIRAMIPEFGSELTDVLGEFFFLPIGEEDAKAAALDGTDELWFFTTVITVSDSLPPDSAEEIAATVARLNYMLPCGCYAMGNTDSTLVYRMSVPILANDEPDKQERELVSAVNLALMTAERFVGYLVLIAEGKMSCGEFLRIFRMSE